MKAILRAVSAALALLMLCGAVAEDAASASAAPEGAETRSVELPPIHGDLDAPSDPDGASELPREVPAEAESPEESESPAPDETSAPGEAEPAPEETSAPGEAEEAPAGSLRFENGDLTIGRNERVKGALRPVPGEGAQGEIAYSSSDEKIVRVDAATGELFGAALGSATITASMEGGAAASCTVTVCKIPNKLKLKPESAVLGAGESTGIEIGFNSGAHSYARNLKSSNENVARLEGERVVAVGPGNATISGKTYNGKKASFRITVKQAPAEVKFAELPDSLGVGEALPLEASVNEGAAGAIRYTIASGAEFAALDGNSLLAAAPGEAIVRAEAYNGAFAERSFAVLPAPGEVRLAEAELTLGLGEKLEGALHVSFDEGCGGSARFFSSRPGVVQVDAQSGKLTAKKRGTAEVWAVSYNNLESGRCKITVRSAPKKITLSLPMKACSVGQIQTARVKLAGGEGRWTLKSSDPSVIEIRGADQLAAVGVGQAKITAQSFNGKKSSVRVTVVAAPEAVLPEREFAQLVLGLPERIAFLTPNSYATFRYESSNPSVASVEPDGDGTVTPLAEGEAVITATAHNGLSASTRVQVCLPAQALVPDAAEITLAVGERAPFAFHTVPEGSLAKYAYESSDPSVARVDDTGSISGMKIGSAAITVSCQGAASAQIAVRVVSYSSRHSTDAIAHRGASAYRRENTPDAFRYAAELGAESIETDVRLTRDNQIVLFHDRDIKSGKKSKSVSSLTLSELKAIDPRIVTLDEGLDCIAELPIKLLIEFKSTGEDIERRVVEAVKARGMMDRTAFDSFDQPCIERLHANFPEANAVLVVNTTDKLKKIINKPEVYNFFRGVAVRYTLLNVNNVRDLHLRGLDVLCWTPSSAKSLQRLVEMGVDGIMTNYPDRM